MRLRPYALNQDSRQAGRSLLVDDPCFTKRVLMKPPTRKQLGAEWSLGVVAAQGKRTTFRGLRLPELFRDAGLKNLAQNAGVSSNPSKPEGRGRRLTSDPPPRPPYAAGGLNRRPAVPRSNDASKLRRGWICGPTQSTVSGPACFASIASKVGEISAWL